MELRVVERPVSGVSVLDCSGRLIFGEEAALVRESVKDVLSRTDRILLNLKHVNYIDSGGLGTLVGLFSSAKNTGAEIKLACLTPRVGQLLQVTKLLTVFDVHETEEGALKSFSKGATASA